MKKNELAVRIYYEDTDCGNVVYYANYLKYMERGRTELLRQHGIELAQYHSDGFVFAVVDAKVKYKRPARYNDLLNVVTSFKSHSAASVTFLSSIYNSDTGELLVEGEVRIACVNAQTARAEKIPSDFIGNLTGQV
ncbi:4-hydroxybenzoyl-CoA thioesterase [Chitinispirillum alkaliphilum]|nr:4-hydroxybenzoyl-CoA thioesterase [Chitinispirillum alkaliphilum]